MLGTDRIVLRFPVRAKKKYEWVADLINTYDSGILDDIYGTGPRPWELIVGLSQNASRAELRQAHRVVVGIRSALSPKLERPMWEAICDSPEQVNEAMAIEQSVLDAAAAGSALPSHDGEG